MDTQNSISFQITATPLNEIIANVLLLLFSLTYILHMKPFPRLYTPLYCSHTTEFKTKPRLFQLFTPFFLAPQAVQQLNNYLAKPPENRIPPEQVTRSAGWQGVFLREVLTLYDSIKTQAH